MMNYGHGYYTITAPSGREYLVSYSGHDLNSSVFAPGSWDPPFRSLGLSHIAGGGTSLGGGSARWVDLKARRHIRRRERRLNREERRRARNARFVARQ